MYAPAILMLLGVLAVASLMVVGAATDRDWVKGGAPMVTCIAMLAGMVANHYVGVVGGLAVALVAAIVMYVPGFLLGERLAPVFDES